MVLKTQEYFENTVQKIGFWDSEGYFYEKDKKKKSPPKNKNNTSQSQSGNKNMNKNQEITKIKVNSLSEMFSEMRK